MFIGNRWLWQGREYSWATGLYYFRARWYDPITGRWLSNDPIGISGGLNQYVFCRNNSVNLRDPFGLDALTDARDCYENAAREFSSTVGKALIKHPYGLASGAVLMGGGAILIAQKAFFPGGVVFGIGMVIELHYGIKAMNEASEEKCRIRKEYNAKMEDILKKALEDEKSEVLEYWQGHRL